MTTGITRILLSGFEPFGGESLNPSMAVVDALQPDAVAGVRLESMVLPVERGAADTMLLNRLNAVAPDAVLMLGEAGGRGRVTPERVAINVDDYRLPDNAGQQPREQPVVPDGPAAYFSSLPLEPMVRRLAESGIPAGISNSAGTFLCNRVFYRVMHHLHQAPEGTLAGVTAGFVHLPYLHAQVHDKADEVPSVSLQTLLRAVLVLVETLRDEHGQGRTSSATT